MRLFEATSSPRGPTDDPSEATYRVYAALATLIDRLDSTDVYRTGIIPWSTPIPSFGDLSQSRVATVGLNPSNREFMDERGSELCGTLRRFHTLHSLGLSSWSDVDVRHLRRIMDSCINYFHANPYDRWFKRLDQLVLRAKTSYYGPRSGACHIDLVPYATTTKWAALQASQRAALLNLAGDVLGILLRASSVRVLALNGASVVQHFEAITGVTLIQQRMPSWSLNQKSGRVVSGFSYTGQLEAIAGVPLGYPLLILGFNHNVQSTYGMTRGVLQAMADWVGDTAGKTVQ